MEISRLAVAQRPRTCSGSESRLSWRQAVKCERLLAKQSMSMSGLIVSKPS